MMEHMNPMAAASGGGGMGGGMGSMDMWGNLFSKILQHNSERNQRALQTSLNADMMRYSPWTQLGGQAASAQQSNMQWVPGKALNEEIMKTLGFAKQQDALNARQEKEDEFANKWLKIQEGLGK